MPATDSPMPPMLPPSMPLPPRPDAPPTQPPPSQSPKLPTSPHLPRVPATPHPTVPPAYQAPWLPVLSLAPPSPPLLSPYVPLPDSLLEDGELIDASIGSDDAALSTGRETNMHIVTTVPILGVFFCLLIILALYCHRRAQKRNQSLAIVRDDNVSMSQEDVSLSFAKELTASTRQPLAASNKALAATREAKFPQPVPHPHNPPPEQGSRTKFSGPGPRDWCCEPPMRVASEAQRTHGAAEEHLADSPSVVSGSATTTSSPPVEAGYWPRRKSP